MPLPTPDEALESLNNEESGGSAETTDDGSGHPDPSSTETEGDDSAPQNQESERQTTAQAIADLSKFSKVSLDGKEMSLQELKDSLMRQADYTRKTQEAAQERKYWNNVQADLEKVRGNPGLAAEFKKIYPKHFHGMLSLVQQGQTTSQAVANQAQNVNQLPPEVLERLEKHEQLLGDYAQSKLAAEQQALDAKLSSIEKDMVKKYPYTDTMTAYTLADQHRERIEAETGEKMRPDQMDAKFMEPFFKAAHDYQVKMFNNYQKGMANKAKLSHEAGADIGRGGGTPTSPPSKVKLKDVADHILAGGDV